jgi:hypothetical protein
LKFLAALLFLLPIGIMVAENCAVQREQRAFEREMAALDHQTQKLLKNRR